MTNIFTKSVHSQITKYIFNLISKAFLNIHNYRRFSKVVLAHKGRDGY